MVTEAVEHDVDLKYVTDQLDKDHILWFEIPANNDTVKNGKAITRWISDIEFNTQYRLEDVDHGCELMDESDRIMNTLRDKHGTIIDTT
jgi:hypothetical protein